LRRGGRANEIVILGHANGGSGGPRGSDLALATEQLALFHGQHGLGPRGALLWHPPRDITASLPAAIARSVEVDLQACQIKAEAIIRANQELVTELAAALQQTPTMDGTTFAEGYARRVIPAD
jgi:hypothetical protein